MTGPYFLTPAFLSLGIIFLIFSPALWVMGRSRGMASWSRLWTWSFVANGVGFLCWSLLTHPNQMAIMPLGDFCHIVAFMLVAGGAARFTGRTINRWYAAAAAGILAVWALGLMLWPTNQATGVLFLAVARVLPVGAAALWILCHNPGSQPVGQVLAGWCLVAWACLMMSYPLYRQVESLRALFYGTVVGLHMAAAMGLVVVIADSLRRRAEAGEARVQTLEGLLPICSGCKKVRTDDGEWEEIEIYISQRSNADFTHSLCADCMTELYPEIAQSLAAKRSRGQA